MNAMLGLLIPALLGVDYGWERKPDGSIAYIVQVTPEAFAEMQKSGHQIGSSLPAHLRNRVSDVSFRLGSDPLPNHNTLPPDEPAAGETETTGPRLHRADYPPSTYSATTANWGGAPTAAPTISLPPPPSSSTTANWAQNTTTASSTQTQPLSSSGFPIVPTATPPGTAGYNTTNGYNAATGGYTNPAPTTAGGAFPISTSPPSLNNGPRLTQQQPWAIPPREVSISARMPVEPATNTAAPTTGPNLTPGVVPIAGTAPAYPNNGYAANTGYTGAPLPGNPQFMQNNYQTGAGQPQPNFAGQPTGPVAGGPVAAGQPGDPYFNQRRQEPPSASQTPAAPAATVNAPAAADAQWLPLTLVLIGFLTSLAANFYFGWSTYQLRERCRMLLTDRGVY